MKWIAMQQRGLSGGDKTNSTSFMVKGMSFFLLFGITHLLNYKNTPCPLLSLLHPLYNIFSSLFLSISLFVSLSCF